MVRYAIIDGVYAPGDSMPGHAERLAGEGVDFIQLRMKGAPVREQMYAAKAIVAGIHGSRTRLLLNGRADVALAAGAHGVHLTASPAELTATQVHAIFALAGVAPPIISKSCHTPAEIAQAKETDFLLFGPVFEKCVNGHTVAAGTGLTILRKACAAAPGRVLALGGITLATVTDCMDAGAAGVAGIRLFV